MGRLIITVKYHKAEHVIRKRFRLLTLLFVHVIAKHRFREIGETEDAVNRSESHVKH